IGSGRPCVLERSRLGFHAPRTVRAAGAAQIGHKLSKPDLCPLPRSGFGSHCIMKICAERQKLLECTGHALVIGGPGSGKTTIALMKASLRIQAGLLPGQSVLFLSFSRAAVARVLQAAQLALSRKEQLLLNVQTFHSFFWDLLKAHAYLLGAPRRLHILMPQDERVLNGGLKEDKYPAEWALWCKTRETLFAKEGKLTFDLFAPKAAQLLEESAWIRRLIRQRFPLVIVDEAQDTGPSAWRFVEIL